LPSGQRRASQGFDRINDCHELHRFVRSLRAADKRFGLPHERPVHGTPAGSVSWRESRRVGRHTQPDFLALPHGRHVPLWVYCFDLLEQDGRELREYPLGSARARASPPGRTKCICSGSASKNFPKRASRVRTFGIGDDCPEPARWVVLLWDVERLDKCRDCGVEGREPVPREALRKALAESSPA